MGADLLRFDLTCEDEHLRDAVVARLHIDRAAAEPVEPRVADMQTEAALSLEDEHNGGRFHLSCRSCLFLLGAQRLMRARKNRLRKGRKALAAREFMQDKTGDKAGSSVTHSVAAQSVAEDKALRVPFDG